ncbi:endosome-associated ubiquitin isopeptidase [Moniliophthora roreri MCA 2997]|uniref:Endosome-associated ubiquitin isopeptidase n=2 Tax=Moniliophthora roreri TaxID=221103 RepID=V2WZI5_MONRO|nr:endosome-associated ubiquitin isopeptidase [Moniliophthora roreri MCA 2997]KAI3613022.1 endosome-associated ubiquitin isopeptidase [Moniliophthora roreri]
MSQPHNQDHLQRRPSSIAELAVKARNHVLKENQPIKYYLKHAESNRREGMRLAEAGDLENAFIAFARTASLVLETLPMHSEYKTVLDEKQRTNLNLNGQEILDNLGKLKVRISDRYENWRARHPDDDDAKHREAVEAQMKWEGREKENDVAARLAQERAEKLRRSLERMSVEDYQQQPQQPQPRQPMSIASASAIASARDAASAYDGARYQDSPSVHGQRAQDAVQSARVAASTAAGITATYVPMPAPYLQSPLSSAPAPSHQQPVSIPQFTPTRPHQRPRPSSFVGPQMMPLESPSRYDEDSTDSESQGNGHREYMRPPSRAPSYPPPVTTTSLSPPERIQYPQLMTQHQKTQGYTPSLKSMFNDSPPHDPNANDGSLLLGSSSTLYSHPLPHPPQHHSSSLPSSQYPRPAPAPPAPPAPQPPPPQPDRITRPSSRYDGLPELKTVVLPRDCLPRFLSIAAVNTSQNKETCGLLLGREIRGKYIVSTLLIPKQHSTSDTCTMDEEELVMQFTEERNLITLGWIHTHPTQSCFMSSVDLHTHSGFQRMLPESFAVVCAPKSNPNFGIFRLTDPPGLKTILDCQAKEAFHPHPDIPIYTDADRGHVQMKDVTLAIVDLR